VADLDQEGQEFKVAQGGLGGKGNFIDKQLRISQAGKEGETKQYQLRLKLIGDVGFIGYPNAGKSTLLSAVSISPGRHFCS
jgi:GTP-binding protein